MARILLIDDDLQLVNLHQKYLTMEGHTVITAENGLCGIKLLDESQFDVVITDIIMPEKDGLEVLMYIKKMSVRPKVIAISGGSVSVDHGYLLNMAELMSADAVLPKPVGLDQLSGAVTNVMSKA